MQVNLFRLPAYDTDHTLTLPMAPNSYAMSKWNAYDSTIHCTKWNERSIKYSLKKSPQMILSRSQIRIKTSAG